MFIVDIANSLSPSQRCALINGKCTNRSPARLLMKSGLISSFSGEMADWSLTRTTLGDWVRDELVSPSFQDTRPIRKIPGWGSWNAMIQRCYAPSTKGYEHYGGRGIEVCDRWRGVGGFRRFLYDVGERPPDPAHWNKKKPYYTLDRIDVNGNYEPGNVRWADPHTQGLSSRLKTHCYRGHEFTDENTHYAPQGTRICVECKRINGWTGHPTNADKTHCIHGHEYTEENTRTRDGKRECRTCIRERARAKYHNDPVYREKVKSDQRAWQQRKREAKKKPSG